ncbi:MAG: type II toxin-antitoxin system HicB family antitoxin [Gemmatimonadales bacterium]|nr:type II toxin-antitoxin system HicB family antitoxin [Gemmatimonadales bacterium]
MKYKVVMERSAEWYSVSVPDLRGCWSQGVNVAEAIANIREAISEYLSVRDELIKGADPGGTSSHTGKRLHHGRHC